MMGWLDRWREARAEAAVRRQLAALEGGRGIDSIDVEPVVPSVRDVPVDVADRSTWPADFDDGPVRDVALAVNLPDLLAECARADALAGSHGGFVTTARIREILRGAA